MYKRLIICLLLITFLSCHRTTTEPESSDILQKLQDLPGVTVVEIVPHYGYPRAFQIDITQPVDHNHPNGQQFTQRMYLSHVDESMPMVFAPNGYGASEWSGQEIAGILETNCLNVEHRYFPNSRPNPLDWQYLTIEQSANDHHRIVTVFKQIYQGSWVSSGASKSGMTCLFHRRYFPDDVEATLAYVSPFMFSTADDRFAQHLKNNGTEKDWERIHEFQRMVLENRENLLMPFQQWFFRNGYLYSGDPNKDLEGSVLEYDWSYWQRHVYESSQIPDEDASDQEIINHLAEVVRLYYESDNWEGYFDPWIYQAFTEIGYPARQYDHLEDLLDFEWKNDSKAVFDPYGVDLSYQPETMQDIYQWLLTEGDGIIYIYGSVDPWTGGAIELNGQVDALRFIHPGGDHSVKIADLAEQQVIMAKLEEWMGIEIGSIAKRAITPSIDIHEEAFPSLNFINPIFK